jgi:hypothetical protein
MGPGLHGSRAMRSNVRKTALAHLLPREDWVALPDYVMLPGMKQRIDVPR